MSIGSTLLKNRKRKNYTQQEVADLLEVSQSTYCDWESDRTIPKTENILKITQLYDLDINELLLPNEKVSIVNSPNTINNSPNSKVETPEALLKVAEGLEKLIVLVEQMIKKQ